ncbi:hypothetical protein C8R45DRAFT_1039854 [Mycena sanguinolenta]|nr:hypothetical protein C8R45DRAFT_1039854 [Mycena sanguinolenta]
MPMVRETTNIGIGGAGGVGHATQFGKRLASKAGKSRSKTTIDKFCKEHCLGDEIREKLEEEGFSSAESLVHVTDIELKAARFKIGHIAELAWALKRLVGDTKPPPMPENKPRVSGGEGGAGGHGGHRGGGGGIGGAAGMAEEDAKYFEEIAGGTGGGGGTGGKVDGSTGKSEQKVEKTRTNDTTTETKYPHLLGAFTHMCGLGLNMRIVVGGTGGRGGEGSYRGGVGGQGEGSRMEPRQAALFSTITGGIGGEGGKGGDEGGDGGLGEGPQFTQLLVSVEEVVRDGEPIPLDQAGISAKLVTVLREHGFVTLGGLCEVSGEDVMKICKGKVGAVAGLKEALSDFLINNMEE